jgi:hypothetical protein
MTPEQQIRHFLATGEHDAVYREWPGDNALARIRAAERRLRAALVKEVRHRMRSCDHPSLPPGFDAGRFVLDKVGSMVRGLFPVKERQVMLNLFEKSLVFVTRDNIEKIVQETPYLFTAWQIANLYLGSFGLPGLDDRPARLVGLSEETTFYVSTSYFEDGDPFADWVVHEAAHVFHNWKRDRAGLPSTSKREFLLEIAFAKRELFAYACEAYSRILEQAKSPTDRRRLHAEYSEKWVPDDNRLNRSELVSILAEAVGARNGWKRILRSCSPRI